MVKSCLRGICLLLLFNLPAFCQNYNISNSTVNTCSGNFYDTGGNAAGYGNGQNFVMTFCSNVAGNCVRLTFSQFNIENGYDFLTIYDGPNTGSAVMGTYTGNGLPPVLTSTSGCLTIEFTSDPLFNGPGWAAALSCVPCPVSTCPTCSGGPAPANDPCSGAQNLGGLPVPAGCPNGTGAWANFNTTNICATAENPYTTLTGCQPSGNMASPAADVWYRFTITGPTLNVSINGIQNPNIGLYAGTNCNNLIGRGCAVGGGGTLNTQFGGLAPGTYFLQVSGGNLADQCDFTLGLQNNYDCAGCVIQSGFTATPPPVNGTYSAGQTVTFCYTITDYNQTSVNWLHGIVPTFGAGWDMTTLTTVPANDCSGQGTWSWYNTTVTSTATGLVTGPGFYYESALGSPGGVTDGNPGNNYGDNNPGNLCDWTFCWTITTMPPALCVQGASLNITVDTYGDGESGSWTSLACVGDPVTDFFAVLACCDPPVLAITDPVCPGPNTGSVTATGQGTAPWDYVWMDASASVIQTSSNINGSNTINGLAPGNYSLTVTDNTNCSSTVNFTITSQSVINASTITGNADCFGTATGSIEVNANGGTGALSYSLNGGPGQASNIFNNLLAGNYTVTITDANGCSETVNTTINEPPLLQVALVVNDALCFGSANGSIVANANGGTGALTYSLNGGPGQILNTFGILPAGNYTVVVTDSKGCTVSANAVINQPPVLQGSAVGVDVLCNGAGNGTITANGSGGTGAVNYSINGGPTQASPLFTGLVPGLYNVVITDANGCQVAVNVVINEPPVLQASIASTDALCNGSADGTVTSNANGGAGAITFSLNGGAGQASGNFTGLTAGNYTVVATDANGCTISVNTVISEPTLLQANISATDALCNGSSDGTVTAGANGGTGAITYSLNGGPAQASGNFTGLPAGNYTVIATDANGCTASANIVVAEPTLVQASISATDALCNGSADGTITVNSNGGTGAHNYSLNGGAAQGSGIFNNLTAGNYSVLVTDFNGCTATVNIAVNEPTVVQASIAATDALCNGSSDGTLTVTAGGGTGALSYSLNGGAAQPSNIFNGLPAGNYSVVVTDANGCTATANSVINEPTLLQLSLSVTDALCNGSADGTLDASGSGGTGIYSFSLNGGAQQASGSFTGLTAGNYTVVVTDANNCTATASIIINEPTLVQIALASTDALCNGSADGTVTATAGGGTGILNYTINGGPSQASNIFTGLVAGNYNVVVTDANGCSATANIAVNEPTLLQAATVTTDALCNGSADGTITANANGGIAAYTYSLNGGAAQGSGLFTGLQAGNYSVLVTDANGCTVTVNTVINEPTLLQISLATTDALCFGSADGTVDATASGGTAAYDYSLNGGASQASGLFTGLIAGSYTVVTTDANGCTASASINVNEPTQLQASISATDALCNGSADGTITVSANGGTGAYSYSLNGGVSQASNNFIGLTAGNYDVVVTDANGCTVTVNISVLEPTLLQLSLSSTDALCFGSADGTVDASGNGGTGVLSYSLNGGPGQASGAFTGLTAGNYTVIVTDANNCTATAAIVVNEPTVLQASISGTDALCNGSADGTLAVVSGGGTGAISHSLNGGPGQASGNFSGLTAGNYTVIATDANGCTVSVSIVIGEPVALSGNIVSTPASCGGSDGTLTIAASGGTAPLQYSIDNGTTYQAATLFSGLISGNYDIIVQDANGCTISVTGSVSNTAAPAIVSSPGTNLTCFNSGDGSIVINANGGTPPLQYSIDNGNTFQALNTFNSLPAGNYDLVVMDALGCLATSSIILLQPAQLAVNSVGINTTCGNNNGSLTLSSTGGTGAIQYSINGGSTYQASNAFNGLAAGNFAVAAIDANGCTATNAAVLTDAPGPALNVINATDITCNGADDGIININAAGGTPPLQYSIDNGTTYQAATSFNNLPQGNYNIVIIDANGCTATGNSVINEPAAIQVSASTTPASCGNSDGTLTFSASGGTGLLQFSIDNGLTFQAAITFNTLPAATYNLVVQDQNGCQVAITATVNNAAAPVINTTNFTDVTCNGAADGTITINASGGTGALVYSADNGSTFQVTSTFNNLGPGTYDVVVEDVNGCQATAAVTITEPTALSLSSVITNSVCGYGNGTSTLTSSGGTGAHEYSIDNGTTYQAATLFSNLGAGNYTVIVRDDNGCTTTTAFNITDAPGPVLLGVNITDLTCNGSGDGEIGINIAGGTPPLQYSIDNGTTVFPTSNFTGLTAGPYSILVTDANGCTTASPATVNEPQAITASAVTTDATCGNNDGTLTVTANGGSGSLMFSVDNGATFQAVTTFNALFAASYVVLVQDANGCQTTVNATVNNNAAPIIQSVAVTDITCNGFNDGSIQITGSGGTAPLSYSINNGFSFQPSNLFQNLAPGNYTLLLNDANGCEATSQVTILEPDALQGGLAVVSSTCGINNGSLTATITGGTGTLTYALNQGTAGPASIFNNLPGGSYTVTVTDANGCTSDFTANVPSAPGPAITLILAADVFCFGQGNGSITIVSNGGTVPIQYSINAGLNWSSLNVFDSLGPANYNVMISDLNGCTSTGTVSITQPTQVNFSTSVVDATCGNNNGSITFTASGGSGNYTYSIDNGASFQSSNTFTGLVAGNYDAVVRDATDCSTFNVVPVNNSAAPAINSMPVDDVSCNGMGDGTITINAAGGIAPLSYSANGGFNWQPSPVFSNLGPGNYTVIVTDFNGCTATANALVIEPPAITATVTTITATCGNNDGSLTTLASGGTGALNFNLNGGPSQPIGNFINLGAGNYNVIITDATGCSYTAVGSISNTNAPAITNVGYTDPDCPGATNGSITVTATGGSGPLNYSINNGTTFQSTGNFSNLSGGPYSIVVTDSIGCITSNNVQLADPDPLQVGAISTDATCGNNNGTISLLASGGTGVLNYSIDNGTTFQTDTAYSNLVAGSYTIVIADAHGCTVSTATNIAAIPGPVMNNVTTQNSSCNNSDDGTATVNISGGTTPFTYSINGGTTTQSGNYFDNLAPGIYPVLVIDDNGCETDTTFTVSEPPPIVLTSLVTNSTCSNPNASFTITATGGNGGFTFSADSGFVYQPQPLFNNLAAGNYNIAVNDLNGCTAFTTLVVTDAPGPVISTIPFSDITCFGSGDGIITIQSTGGTQPISYSINNGSTNQLTNQFNNLTAGSYNILVTDSNGCTASQSAAIVEPAILASLHQSTAALCNGSADGTASLLISGGIQPYTYTWQGVAGNTALVTGLVAGSYPVMIADSNGCQVADTVVVTEPDVITLQGAVTDLTCNGSNDGTITVSGVGGTGILSYNWTGTGFSGSLLVNAIAGGYSVIATDANGCTATQSYTITEPLPLAIVTTTQAVTCFGTSTGNTTTFVSGGTAPYTYLWSNNTTGNALNGVVAGNYAVTITDDHGCTETTSVLITEPTQLVVVPSSTNLTCHLSGNGTAGVTATGGTLPYNYSWTNGQTTAIITGLAAGNYSVVVTDSNGCSGNVSALILQPDPIIIRCIGTTTLCIGQSTMISAAANGGNGTYTYYWSNGATTATQQVSPGTTTAYTVTATDINGCTALPVTVNITVNPALSLMISDPDTICVGEISLLTANATGGDGGPYSYTWTGSTATTATIQVSPALTTQYTVTASDGCGTLPVNASVQVMVHPLPLVDFVPVPAEGCAPLLVNFTNNSTTINPGATYEWEFGDQTTGTTFQPDHLYNEPGNYDVTLTVISVEGCKNQLTIDNAVRVYPVPEAAFSTNPDKASILDPFITFNDQSHGATWWNWDFGDQTFSQDQFTTHTYLDTGTFQIILYIANDYGCRDTAYSEIIIEGATTVYIPNAFTPNNDGKNETFTVSGIGIANMEMSIFNRWGNVVFQGSSLSHEWDGRDQHSGNECPGDVYVYLVRITNDNGIKQDFTGKVTLVR